jgi:hypothetical protein
MASYQITHIRLSNPTATSTEHITHVKLSTGIIESVPQVVAAIERGHEYYYTTSPYTRATVEVVRPTGRPPYIRTKANQTTRDNLLSLPRF